ncbi:MAG: DUF4345 family protein [Actinomycetota bacterium]
MRNLARVLAGVIALLFIGFGLAYMFSPEGRLDGIDLEATSNLGLATIRAFVGGSFLTFGILLVMHTVIGQETGALRFAILFLLLSIVGRVVSLIDDGTGNDAIRNLVPVGIMLAVSVMSLALFIRSGQTDPAIEPRH